MNRPRIMLLACGSFSPPTPMHLRMFEIARDYFEEWDNYDLIGGIISPVHDSYGKKGLVLSKYRCSMVKLALQSSNWIRLSDWESKQNQWTKTIDTLRYHQNFINNFINDNNSISNDLLPEWLPDGITSRSDNVQIKLLCGGDLLESFSIPGLWKDEDIEDILLNHGIVVVTRDGSNPEKFIFESDLLSKYQKNIIIVRNWVVNEVSSSLIRRLLARGLSVKYLLSDLVIDYIKMNQLFEINSAKQILTPNHNDIVANRNYLNNYYFNQFGNSIDFEDMDDIDMPSKKSLTSLNSKNNHAKVFCCGTDSSSTKSILSCPGQAVQILTESSELRTRNDIKKEKSRKIKANIYKI